MAQTAKNAESPLMPAPREMQRALRVSAVRAMRMAAAHGLKVPGKQYVAPDKNVKGKGG